jgi:hypothetical protein
VRIHFEDHAGFQRAALQVTVACSAVGAMSVAAGLPSVSRLGPAAAVLAAAVATLTLALTHVRLVVDPVADALARAGAAADDAGRALLARAARAHDGIARAARREGAPARERREGVPARQRRALADTSARAAAALADLVRRRQELAREIERALPADAADELVALEGKRELASDAVVREAYGRAAAALRERATRARALGAVVERIDSRLAAATAELEGTAFAVATRAELATADPPGALAAACDRLRAAHLELGAEHDALAELAAL